MRPSPFSGSSQTDALALPTIDGVPLAKAGAGNGGNPTLAVGTLTQTAGSTQLARDNGNFDTLSSSSPLSFLGGSGRGRCHVRSASFRLTASWN